MVTHKLNISTIMKKILASALFVFAMSFSLLAQDNTTQPIIRFDFIKVEPQKVSEYLKLENDWRKVHEAMRKEGKILRWMHYEVLLPSGSEVHHNYMTATIYKDYAALENIVPDLAVAFAKVYPERNFLDFLNKSDQIRNRVRTEVFQNTDGYWNPKAFFQHKYARIDFMKTITQNTGAYLESESTFWKPAHKVAVENGQLNGWQLCSKLYASDQDDYNRLTVSFFTSFAQSNVQMLDFKAWLKKAHPGLTENDLMEKIGASLKLRNHYRSELIKLIDSL
jgi:hypothetical protein